MKTLLLPITFFVSFSIFAAEMTVDVVDPNIYQSDLFFGNDLTKAPISATVITADQLTDQSPKQLSDLSRSSAAVSSNYSTSGYYDYLSLRGIPLDNKNNVLRNGLPIIGDTPLFLQNQEQIQIIKGTYGLFSGVAAPGGLMNIITEPEEIQLKATAQISLQTNQGRTVLAQYQKKLNNDQTAFVLKALNKDLYEAHENSAGSADHLYLGIHHNWNQHWQSDLNLEYGQQSQPSRPGWSLWGSTVPTVPDTGISLNKQSWAQPVQFKNTFIEMKNTFQPTADWKFILQNQRQMLVANDRVLFPYGCSAENIFDRFCNDGSFDAYDYRSDHEKKSQWVHQIQIQKKWRWADFLQTTTFTIQDRQSEEKFQNQAYNYIGIGQSNGQFELPPDDRLLDPNTDRTSVNRQFSVHHQIEYQIWKSNWGFKYNELNKNSIRTDSSRPISANQYFHQFFASIGYELNSYFNYLSYSEGFESYITPNKNSYTNPGLALDQFKSDQWEMGFKENSNAPISMAVFRIRRPHIEDVPPFYGQDGIETYWGAEFEKRWMIQSYSIGLSGQFLNAKITENQQNAAIKNQSPTNVAAQTAIADVQYSLFGPDWTGKTDLQYTGSKFITAANDISIPAVTIINTQISWQQDTWKATAAVENIFDQKYWKESPTQFGHIYLFPGQERSFSLSLKKQL